jgi:dihydroflavonol-4-reductase
MKKISYLLTGAAGFLGNNIARELISRGKKVRAFVLDGDPAAKDVPKEAEIVYGDLTNLDSVKKLFDIPKDEEIIVIHCASVVALSPEPSELVYNVNVDGTKNIVNQCVEHNVKKLVYISSTGAIPELPNKQIIYEVDSFIPDNVVGYYSQTKALATQCVLDAVHNQNLDASIIFPTGICGPNDYAFGPVAGFVIKYCKGEMAVGIEGSFNSVDVRDLAKGVVNCTEKGRKGEGYIMGNEVVSMRSMFKLISKASGAKMVENILPAEQMIAALKSRGLDDEKQIKGLEFQIYNLTRNNNFSSEKAIKELDYKTRPFEETIVDTVDWLRREGRI